MTDQSLAHNISDNETARAWLADHFAPTAATWAMLDNYVARLLAANRAQNLIAASTEAAIWTRHIADCAQLLDHVDGGLPGNWLDLGSGAGLPGMVVAILTDRPVHLVESRRLRATFLAETVAALGLDQRVVVHHARLEQVPTMTAAVISARAFAPLDRLLGLAQRFSHAGTVWVLPKGRSGAKELANLPRTWQALFHVKPSLTDADAQILVGRGKASGQAR